VQNMEKATNSIMEAIQKDEEALGEIRGMIDAALVLRPLDKMIIDGSEVFLAYPFQNIRDQRINRVETSVIYVEERANTLVGMWDKKEPSKVIVKGINKTDDAKILQCLQHKSKGIQWGNID
jgi:hypothetical protein